MRTAWTPERVGLLKIMKAEGWTQRMMAAHPDINSTREAVAQQFSRKSLEKKEPRLRSRAAVIPKDILDLLRPAAKARRCSRQEVAASILSILGSDMVLLDNVLDDGVTT